MSTDLTLATLLAHPAAKAAVYIAGPEQMTWARVQLAGSLEELEPTAGASAELAVVLQPVPDASWQQDALIRSLRDLGFTGVAMPGAGRLHDATRDLAERFGVTVIETSAPFALAKAAWHLEEHRDALTLSYVRKAAQAFDYPAAVLEDLIEHLYASLGHPLALVNSNEVLVEIGASLDDALHGALDFGPWLSTATVGSRGAVSVRVDNPARAGMRLVIFDEGLGPMQLRALGTAAEVMMPAVAARIMIDEHAMVSEQAAASQLLADFLEYRGPLEVRLERSIEQRGWPLSGYHLGVALTQRERLDSLELLGELTRLFAQHEFSAFFALSGQQVLGWVNFVYAPTVQDLRIAGEGLREIFHELREGYDVALGVGSLRNGHDGLRETLDEAIDASKMAVNRSDVGYFVRVDSFGLEQLLQAWTGNDAFLPAAESFLAPIMTESADLLETLTVFLDHESGVQATADALALHRNTVAGRIARARELLGVDFGSPEARLALHLACRTVLG